MSTERRTARPLKVLFFSQDGKLGDAVVNTAFVAALRRSVGDCEIHATVAGVTAAFWSEDPRLARLWPMQRPGWGHTVRTGLAMRRERYDYIVTWQRLRKEKNKLLLWLAKPGRVIDLREHLRGPLQHQVASCAAALAQMRLAPPAELAYDIAMPARCPELDASLAPGLEVIVLNLFAADAGRSVAPEQAQQLLHGLQRLAPHAVLGLVCTDATAAIARQVLQQVQQQGGAVARLFNCEGNLPRLLRLCQRADLLVSPDTALIHIASAYDTAVIGIYQNNGVKAVQWAPRSRRHARVLSADPDSIAGFAVDEVLAQARVLLAR